MKTQKYLLVDPGCKVCEPVKNDYKERISSGEFRQVKFFSSLGKKIRDATGIEEVPACIVKEDGTFRKCTEEEY